MNNDVVWRDQGQKSSVPGLQLRRFPTGKSSYYLYYRTRTGKQRRPCIGDASVLSLDLARQIAKDWLAQVALGGDPSKDIQVKREEMSVSELFDIVWKKYWSVKRYQESGYAEEVMRNWTKNLLPYFGHLKLSELTAGMLRQWLSGLKPYPANRSLVVLSRMYNFAEEMEWRPQHTNPCKLVKKHEERTRDRYATPEEIIRLGEILEREALDEPEKVAFIYLLLYTGARPRAIERATWKDLEIREVEGSVFGILTVIKGKSGKPEKIYIPSAAMKILTQIPGRVGSLAGKFPRVFWEKVRKEAGLQDLWARDLRRTFATISMSEGHSMAVISELLNHASTQTTKIYAKLNDRARHSVAKDTATRIEQLLQGKVNESA